MAKNTGRDLKEAVEMLTELSRKDIPTFYLSCGYIKQNYERIAAPSPEGAAR